MLEEIRERIRAAIERELENDPGNAYLEQQAVMTADTIILFCLLKMIQAITIL